MFNILLFFETHQKKSVLSIIFLNLYTKSQENSCSDIYLVYSRINLLKHLYRIISKILCYEMDKTSIFMVEILEPGGQLWANTAFKGSQFYSIGVPKFYSWVNVISVYAYNDLG